MSFGFGVGDFIAAAELSWNLYRYCYVVARGAPQEFQLLLQEITSLSQSIKLLQEEAKDPNSTLIRSGQARIDMVKEMMARVVETLKELEKHAKKYEKLGDKSRAKRKQMWDKFRWSVDATDLDSLRNKLVYHNGIINLLLTSCGNSSLQRIESSTMRLERRFSQIGDLVQKAEGSPTISGVSGAFKAPLLTAELMKNAEIGHRRWSSIGVDEWIQAGRWWLLKSESAFFTRSATQTVSGQGYADLIKASWILIDVIARHPQLNLLEAAIRYDVELLADAIRTDFERIESAEKPSFDDIRACDLGIWVTQAKGPSLQPGKGRQNIGDGYSWETDDENVLFQRFARYQPNDFGTPTPCIILFVANKKQQVAHIVLRDQSWITLATFRVGEIHARPEGSYVYIGDQKIEFSTSQEAQYMAAIAEAVEEYILHCIRHDGAYDTLHALTLLFAMKSNYQDLVEILLEDKSSLQSISSSPETDPSPSFREATMQLARQCARGDRENNDLKIVSRYTSVFFWVAHEGYTTVARLLLERKGIKVAREEDVQQWISLHKAAQNGRIGLVRFILSENGADIHAEDDDGRTALELASCGGHIELVKELLSRGALYRETHFRSLTTLQQVAGMGYEEVLQLMIEAGVDVNAPAAAEANGCTALCAGAKGGYGGVVEMLLRAGADPNIRNKVGYSPLCAGVESGYEPIVERLLMAGAEVNPPGANNGSAGTALQAAARCGYDNIVERLLRAGAEVNAKGPVRALQAAARGGYNTIVERLLRAGAEVNAPGADTALQAAARGGFRIVVETLLKAGAEVNAPRATHGRGGTALQAAASEGHGTVVEILLQAGAEVDAPGANYGSGDTALQAAARGGFTTIVERLLKAGAEVNEPPEDLRSGDTALQAAARGGYDTIIEKLLRAGAYVNAPGGRDGNGRTALQAAARGGHRTAIEILLQAGANVNAAADKNGGRTALQAAVKGGHEALVERLLEAGADVNAPGAQYGNGCIETQQECEIHPYQMVSIVNKQGKNSWSPSRTALQVAAGEGHKALVDRLLDAGADVNAELEWFPSCTALQAAAQGGHEALVERLLTAGADIDASYYMSPLEAAAVACHVAVIEILLKMGATVDVIGVAALTQEANAGHQSVMVMLLNAGANVHARHDAALRTAARAIHANAVEPLLQAAADTHADDGAALSAATGARHVV